MLNSRALIKRVSQLGDRQASHKTTHTRAKRWERPVVHERERERERVCVLMCPKLQVYVREEDLE